MAIDYETLTGTKGEDGSIRQWVNHAGVPATVILTLAEQNIYRKIRIREMLQSATGTVAAGASTIALPAGYRQRNFLMFTGANKSILTPKLLDEVEANFTYDSAGDRTTGIPRMYGTDDTNIIFETELSEARDYHFRYYGDLTALSNSNPTNILTTRYAKLLYTACMVEAYEWSKNEREKMYWQKVMQGEVYEANKEMDQELAGVEMTMVTEGGDANIIGTLN
jgi:hypothetical protein